MPFDLNFYLQRIAEADDLYLVRRDIDLIYNHLYKSFFNILYSAFKKFMPPRIIEELEEGYNDGWARVLKKIKLYDSKKAKNPKNWLLIIIKNEVHNYFNDLNKKTIINKTIALPTWNDESECITDIVFVEAENPITIYCGNELDYLIKFFIDNDEYLNKNHLAKEFFILNYYDNLNDTNMAKKINIANSTITKYKEKIKPRLSEFLRLNGWDIN